MPVRKTKQKGASSSSKGSMEGEKGAIKSRGLIECKDEKEIWKEYTGSVVIKTFKKQEDFEKELEVAKYLANKNFSYKDYNYAFGTCDKSRLQLQLPLVVGKNIEKFKKELDNENERLPILTLLGIMKTLCNNVNNLLINNIYHNDLHPKNIMIVQDGDTYRPVIIDFGETVINNNSRPKFPRLGELMASLRMLWTLRQRDKNINLELKDIDTIDVITKTIYKAESDYNQSEKYKSPSRMAKRTLFGDSPKKSPNTDDKPGASKRSPPSSRRKLAFGGNKLK